LTWPNGTYATIFSGANPDQIRGFSGDTAWLDEFAAWQKPRRAWQNITLALREGDDPRCCITTTPRPLKVLEEIEEQNGTEVVTGSSFENRDNLSERYYEQVIEPLESTEKGRQEIYAEYIDATGDLWDWDMIEHAKEGVEPVGDMTRIVVAVDPAATSNEDSDETGIIVVAEGTDDRFYVLEDCSLKNTPGEWTREAVNAYQRHEADRVIAETNNGGDMVETIMRNQQENIPYDSVRATRGKVVRAEPVAVMYEQQNVKHVQAFPELEEQMVHFQQNGGESPDRLDALVWGLTYLTQEGDTGSGGVARLLWP
jgi:predicted phage terminase large subunit-like protein